MIDEGYISTRSSLYMIELLVPYGWDLTRSIRDQELIPLYFFNNNLSYRENGEKEKQKVKKQDLKAGMVVEVRGGSKYLISDEKFEFINLKDGQKVSTITLTEKEDSQENDETV